MAHKKHGLFTLIKVGVISFFYFMFCEYEFLSKDPKYDKLKHITYSTIKLGLVVLLIIFILGVLLGKDSIIFQGCFIIYGIIIVCGFLFGMIEYFKIWRTFFKERLEKEDKEE